MAKKRSALARRTRLEAHAFLGQVVIIAEGELPTAGYEVDIDPRPGHDGIPAYQLIQRPKPGLWPTVVTPFRYGEMFQVEQLPASIEVYHAEGVDQVHVAASPPTEPYDSAAPEQEQVPREGPTVHVATGFSPRLSFDEAFTDAVQNLPPFEATFPDQMAHVKVEEIGAVFGGVAAFHQLYVRVRREIA